MIEYVDSRRREEQRHRFEQFRDVMKWVAGRTEDGITLVDIHQLSAIYQLSNFREFQAIYMPVLRYMLVQIEDGAERPSKQAVIAAIETILKDDSS